VTERFPEAASLANAPLVVVPLGTSSTRQAARSVVSVQYGHGPWRGAYKPDPLVWQLVVIDSW
jgi:hypothetical protein